MSKYNQTFKTLWKHFQRCHDRRVKHTRSQRDARPRYRRRLQRGRNSSHLDRG